MVIYVIDKYNRVLTEDSIKTVIRNVRTEHKRPSEEKVKVFLGNHVTKDSILESSKIDDFVSIVYIVDDNTMYVLSNEEYDLFINKLSYCIHPLSDIIECIISSELPTT